MTPQHQLPTKPGRDLTGRTAIVTGASRGIGLAAAQAIAAAGGNVVLTSRSQESADAAAMQVNGSAVGVAAHAVDFWLSTEDLPQPDNRVTLGPDGAIHLAYTPSNPTAAKRLYHQLHSMLGSLGMHPGHLAHRFAYMKTDIPVAGCAHQAGTVRFGSDPATSVLNPDCRAHELDNLYVVDTSFFPSISAVNPALTAMANAVRVGDHLLQRLG